jgi:thiamine biosynthesis lipoprotein
VTVVVLPPAPTADVTFRALGTGVRLIVTGSRAAGAVADAKRFVLDYHARLSRFLPSSELCALNADPRPVVPASPLLRSAVRAGLWAARRSGGLVDPCLLDALEAAGYVRSYEPSAHTPPATGAPQPAEPHPDRRWRAVRVDDDAGTIARLPGLRLDLGGSGKGHVADLLVVRLAPFREWVVDCGGDIRVRGVREIEIARPATGPHEARGLAARVVVRDGAVATSSVVTRAWTMPDGRPAHHLLDPSTGRPAWTGLLTATAFAPTTLEAETLAKVALLRGPGSARRMLAANGGVLVLANGDVETVPGGAETVAGDVETIA